MTPRPTSGEPDVCFVVRYFTVGGLERVVISLANALAQRGRVVRVVALGVAPRNILLTELDPRIEVVSLQGGRVRRLAAALRFVSGRVVHLHLGDGRLHPVLRLLLPSRGLVVTYHSDYTHKRTRLENTVDRLLARRVVRVVAVSAAARRFCVEEVGLRDVQVIPNAIPPGAGPAPRLQHAPARHGLRLVSLAGLYPHKNQRLILEGMALARRRGLDVRLTVIGDGPQVPALLATAKNLGLADTVDWYGGVWRRDLVQPLLHDADAFVSASTFEGLPISILEALDAGLPLLLSAIGSHREVGGEAARYFAPDDAAELAERISELRDPAVLARLRALSVERSRVFDFDEFVAAHTRLYAEVAG